MAQVISEDIDMQGKQLLNVGGLSFSHKSTVNIVCGPVTITLSDSGLYLKGAGFLNNDPADQNALYIDQATFAITVSQG